jgi:hypothetical protein
MNKESVHLISTLLWGIYGLTVGTVSLIYNSFNPYVMVTLVSAIVGNSAHLISMSYGQKGLEVQAQK